MVNSCRLCLVAANFAGKGFVRRHSQPRAPNGSASGKRMTASALALSPEYLDSATLPSLPTVPADSFSDDLDFSRRFAADVVLDDRITTTTSLRH